MKSDIEIAQSIKLKPIEEIGAMMGLKRQDLELHGDYIAKIKLDVIDRLKKLPNAKYIDVTAITPTPLGEGKTVTTLGTGLALNKIGKKAIIAIRQPSMGPTFGIKGGAAGGGWAQALPMEDFNLHLTGDIHAVTMAHNLAAAYLDNHLQKGNALNVDPFTITWRRILDVSDRALRHIVIGLGGKADGGIPRESGFDISVSSEVMAILALTTGLQDIRKRLARIVLAFTKDGKPVTTEDIKVAGAMAVLMKDAIKPNLMQTTEHTPVLVHAGPFANIAHGNSSILADMIAIKSCEYLVTESGFGADIGMEKFLNIKCRMSGLVPDAIVLVCTVRALKMHSGKFKVVAGKPLAPELIRENIPAIEEGICNLEKHIENIKLHGLECVVAINRFATDTDNEIKFIKKHAEKAGALAAVPSEVHAKGGAGGTELAKAVVAAAEKKKKFKFLYPLEMSIKDKIETIATKVYGASGADYTPLANEQIERYTKRGFDKLPICMAKTHLSLSHDPKVKGRPTGYRLPIREVRASVGAGFLYPLCGTMSTMPGLPSVPVGEAVDVDKNGRVVGLF
ncbi:MAG: formate--tetrahydrofolate ligase [Candidatus Abyssobacteria bacterium SURF_17]|uniref:Formate--tetrahydrofolate ligase n=1 Tax=Candidatus Abyssobacteria bacterium SURF_17 TaxID=2093361 RepID=A0A419EUV9_9BACT|nr:MAG: formate--tetrahydrofolate ligase [Candidatus Abyssubacteria bacterium SURF_17]